MRDQNLIDHLLRNSDTPVGYAITIVATLTSEPGQRQPLWPTGRQEISDDVFHLPRALQTNEWHPVERDERSRLC